MLFHHLDKTLNFSLLIVRNKKLVSVDNFLLLIILTKVVVK